MKHHPVSLRPTPTSDAESASSSVHDGSARQPSSAGILEHGHALDERADDRRLPDGTGAAVEQVSVEHGQVGQLADLERARLVVEVVSHTPTLT
jgi:hypothetical protein